MRRLAVLCRGGLPLLEAVELTAAELQSPAMREAHQRLLAGAPVADCFAQLPATLRPFVRQGERTGGLLDALDEVCQWWALAADSRLPLLYLGRALESLGVRSAFAEGREVFECHPEWREIAWHVGQGKPLGEAVRERSRVLPRPLDSVIARAEASQVLPRTLQAIGRGALQGLVAYEPSREAPSIPRQSLFSMALMLIAGAPLEAAIQAAGAPLASGSLEEDGLAGLMSRHSEVFPPSVIALIRRAEYAGDLARTLEFIAQEVMGR
ncbi:type II secretion system F family protein [Pyxidicoccus sp. MSG2]|uniref:type II secretion system F family protein n=1 Tax=Pyxidicoccus sp. MSG2 TaxID=2996790 RepID=UPI00226EC06C|nr:type II secretion system F family protein [Pyxidicoccus sp. MSG2]MCY1022731.1 type II secretion system F family protein [Pyxidicoccus sp. MSG2]